MQSNANTAALSLEAAAANPTTPERFNENAVGLSGVVQRVVARDGNIALRLLSRSQTEAYVNITLLGGTVGGKHVSVGKGDRIAVTGYLIDAPYEETLALLFAKADQQDRIVDGDHERHVERIATHVVAQTLAYLPQSGVNDENSVKLSGVVKQTWTAKKDLLARLDVYDRETPVVGESTQLPGAAHRRAHHVTVKFVEGKTLDGRLAKIARGDRILVTGYIQHAQYSEGLNKLLLKARQPERIIDGDDDRRVSRESTFVVAETMVRFSARPKSIK